MPNNIAAAKKYTDILDAVYQREATSTVLNSPARLMRAGKNAKEIMIPKISVTGLGDYTRNVGYKTGSIDFIYETKTFGYDRGIKLLADVMDVEEAGIMDCFVQAGAELQRVQVAPEADAYTFSEIAGHDGVTPDNEDFADAEAGDVLASLRAATNKMDESQVSTRSRILFLANPARSNRVLERFSKVVEVPQVRFYTEIELQNGDGGNFGYKKAVGGRPINYMVVEKSAVIKFDKHTASRVFSPDELENVDSYMRKYRKYGIVELFDNKLDGVHVSANSNG